ncbi:MAG TPA: hypothetical protein VMF86_06675, partial [Stellaceae bacterium]|nr:hypothetical protein [Stellaceae bacterium]
MGSGETWQSLEAMVLRIEHFLRQHEAVNPGDLAKMLRHYVDQRNHRLPARPVSFESLVRLIVTEKPKSYWEMLDRPNPRKGRPTPRRSPRRRKTAYGLRQDGSGKPTAPGSTPAC